MPPKKKNPAPPLEDESEEPKRKKKKEFIPATQLERSERERSDLESTGEIVRPVKIPDYRVKTLQKFERPYFSPHIGSYEMDCWSVGGKEENMRKKKEFYAVININTKYLFVFALPENRSPKLEYTKQCIEFVQNRLARMKPPQKITSIRGDAARVFGTITNVGHDYRREIELQYLSRPVNKLPVNLGTYDYVFNVFSEFLYNNNIRLFLSSSPYTNKCRIADRVIRTIRDKVGENHELLFDNDIVARVVYEYNHTPHSAFGHQFTPYQVQINNDLEEYFIREHMYEAARVKDLQMKAGLLSYTPGDILLIHVDESKTAQALRKVRRVFNRLGEFVRYDFGNVVCNVLGPGLVAQPSCAPSVASRQITLPIQFTKFLAKTRFELQNEKNQYLKLVV
jgi:hypothetical protein